MKFAVFSDIHGNAYALKQMLIDTKEEKLKGYICCGDIAGYYYNQEETIKLLQNLDNLFIVLGNHDKQYMEAYQNPELERRYSSKYGQSYSEKSPFVYNYLNEAPEMLELNIAEHRIGIFHGSPEHPLNGRIYPDHLDYNILFNNYDVCFLGHTHYQLYKKVGNTVIVNPGSLGQPRDGKGFSYCIFDFESITCEFRTVHIQRDKLKKQVMNKETNEMVRAYLITVLDRGENVE
jgi:putative phosphoesterase